MTKQTEEKIKNAINNLRQIGAEMVTQDNLMTNIPLFNVYELRKEPGYMPEFAQGMVWYGTSYREVIYEERIQRELDAEFSKTGIEPEGYKKVGFRDKKSYVTTFFTMKAAEQFIKENGRNLVRPFVYVDSGWNNEEMVEMRSAILAVSELKPGNPMQSEDMTLVNDGKVGKYKARVEFFGDPGQYDEMSVQVIDENGDSKADVLVGLTCEGEPRIAITTDGDGIGDKNIFVYPLRAAQDSVEIETQQHRGTLRPQNP